MDNYIFHGLILPERANIVLRTKCDLSIEKIRLNIQCECSKIVATCFLDNSDINLSTLKNIVENTIRTLIDSYGFTVSCGYDVEIESAYNFNSNELTIFGVHEPIFDDVEINKNTNNGNPHPDTSIKAEEIAILAGINIELQIALADFREAIRQPSFTSFHCFRAIESLRQSLNGKEKTQWKELSKIVKVDHNDIGNLKKRAFNLRHGKMIPQSWEERKADMLITWQILNKFINWLYLTNSTPIN